MSDVTQLLAQIESGDPKAASDLFPLVYGELRRLANWQMANEKPGHTLQATALVHEAYVKLVGSNNPVNYSGKRGFFAAASLAMRHILVDSVRQKMAQKRGGNFSRQDVELTSVQIEKPAELVAVHEALDALKEHDSHAAEVVTMHYFGGFSIAEIAELHGVSIATISRRWNYARIWLRANIVDAK